MLVAVTSIVGYSWSSKSIETPLSSAQHTEAKPRVSTTTDDDNFTPTATASSENSASHSNQAQAGALDGKILAENLSEFEGKALFDELDGFWTLCQQRDDCTEQLARLKSELPGIWFELLSDYPQLSVNWQLTQSTIPLESIETLEERVALFKQSAQQIWGELAHQLFADQFAHLDFTLDANTLKENEASQFLANYQDLLSEWQNNTDTLNAETQLQKYELAVSLIPSSYSPAEIVSVKADLQEAYLDETQASNIAAREQQVAQQQQTVVSYHEQLDQLKATLDFQRTSSYGTWTQHDWDSYYQQQVSDFREQFFSK
ncbi:chromosome partitioning protein ParA [Vibrio splendidus]|uniref:chromosome partitioning protein ParA n=1 Tax=Vibrio splendidus TaxID=29497 RepID=UPI000C83855C|nr:chromosome partitioning protein ParA [Vibrio splendidus]PMI27315.1 chromosome partitioning protein ParA [Vibrio splendidus]PMM34842.1 chromosome partitioning protein ParA [Vibrio splendidus]PTP66184.1 chromosome partitioning protein ParA [Vibrio splendidus]